MGVLVFGWQRLIKVLLVNAPWCRLQMGHTSGSESDIEPESGSKDQAKPSLKRGRRSRPRDPRLMRPVESPPCGQRSCDVGDDGPEAVAKGRRAKTKRCRGLTGNGEEASEDPRQVRQRRAKGDDGCALTEGGVGERKSNIRPSYVVPGPGQSVVGMRQPSGMDYAAACSGHPLAPQETPSWMGGKVGRFSARGDQFTRRPPCVSDFGGIRSTCALDQGCVPFASGFAPRRNRLGTSAGMDHVVMSRAPASLSSSLISSVS